MYEFGAIKADMSSATVFTVGDSASEFILCCPSPILAIARLAPGIFCFSLESKILCGVFHPEFRPENRHCRFDFEPPQILGRGSGGAGVKYQLRSHCLEPFR